MSAPVLPFIVNTSSLQANGLISQFGSKSQVSRVLAFRGDVLDAIVYPVTDNGSSFPYWSTDPIDPDKLLFGVGDADLPPEFGTFDLEYEGDEANELAFNISEAALKTALDGIIGEAVTVTLLRTGVYEVVFSTVGAKSLIGGNPDGLSPQSNVFVSRERTGDVDTREIQIIELLQRPYVFVDTWEATADPTPTVVELRVGSVSAKAMFAVSISPEPYAGTFVIKDSAPLTFNGDANQWQTALGSGWTVVKNGVANLTIERTEAGVYTLTDADINVDNLSVYYGLKGTLNYNSATLFKRFLSETGNSFSSTLQIRYDDGTKRKVLYSGPVTLTKDILSAGSLAPSNWNGRFYTKTETDDLLDEKQDIVRSPKYIFSSFANDAEDVPIEKLWISVSDDAIHWHTINGGEPVYTPPGGEGFRDPTITKVGDTYWCAYTTQTTNHIGLLKSTDLYNWTFVTHVECDIGITANTWCGDFFLEPGSTDYTGLSLLIMKNVDGIPGSTEGWRLYRIKPTNAAMTAWTDPDYIDLGAGSWSDACEIKRGDTYMIFAYSQPGNYLISTASDPEGPWSTPAPPDGGTFLPSEAGCVINLSDGRLRYYYDPNGMLYFVEALDDDLSHWSQGPAPLYGYPTYFDGLKPKNGTVFYDINPPPLPTSPITTANQLPSNSTAEADKRYLLKLNPSAEGDFSLAGDYFGLGTSESAGTDRAIVVGGSEANIDLLLFPKGAGRVKEGAANIVNENLPATMNALVSFVGEVTTGFTIANHPIGIYLYDEAGTARVLWSSGTAAGSFYVDLSGGVFHIHRASDGASLAYVNNTGQLQISGDAVVSGIIRVGGFFGPQIWSGAGTPESAVSAPVGSIFLRSDGGAGTSVYIKESGAGNTGWIAK